MRGESQELKNKRDGAGEDEEKKEKNKERTSNTAGLLMGQRKSWKF